MSSRPELRFANVGLAGHNVGSIVLRDTGMEWRDKGVSTMEFIKDDIESVAFQMFGAKGHVLLNLKDGKSARLDGFSKSDYDQISPFIRQYYGIQAIQEKVASDGGNYGDVSLRGKTLRMTSLAELPKFELKLETVALCVVPAQNRDELEIQFHENDGADREEDSLVQITLHFPPGEEDEEETPAQLFQKEVMQTGVIRSVTGDVIVEFSKEVGNFVTPRGKYAIQMTSSYLHMQGAQYSWKIKYSDITSLFLLDKPDNLRCAFVIGLEKPIRQGTQKYQHLVLETHKLEHSVDVNLTEEEIAQRYDSQLQPRMTMGLSSLVAKIFKVMTQTAVFVPRQFKSFRGDFCVRCSVKTNDGLLYPLSKSLIFINKPTLIIKYDDIETVEFQRYIPSANSATRNFDLLVTVKSGTGDTPSYMFASIERTEFAALSDFFRSKGMNVIAPDPGTVDKKGRAQGAFAGMDLDGDESDEDEEEDADYKSGQSEHSADSDDSGTDEGSDDDRAVKKSAKKRSAPDSSKKKAKGTKGSDNDSDDDEDGEDGGGKGGKGPKKRRKKDPNAPTKAKSAYLFFQDAKRAEMREANPDAKFGDISKLLGERWKALSSDEKAPYEEMARADKERYKAQMKDYTPPSGDEEESKQKTKAKGRAPRADAEKKAKKDKNEPKRAATALSFFTKAERVRLKTEQPDLTAIEIKKELNTRWKGLSADERAPYEDEAKKDKQRYDAELKAFKASKLSAMAMDDDEDDEEEGARADRAEEDIDNESAASGSDGDDEDD